jgi:hypothetical protein
LETIVLLINKGEIQLTEMGAVLEAIVGGRFENFGEGELAIEEGSGRLWAKLM